MNLHKYIAGRHRPRHPSTESVEKAARETAMISHLSGGHYRPLTIETVERVAYFHFDGRFHAVNGKTKGYLPLISSHVIEQFSRKCPGEPFLTRVEDRVGELSYPSKVKQATRLITMEMSKPFRTFLFFDKASRREGLTYERTRHHSKLGTIMEFRRQNGKVTCLFYDQLRDPMSSQARRAYDELDRALCARGESIKDHLALYLEGYRCQGRRPVEFHRTKVNPFDSQGKELVVLTNRSVLQFVYHTFQQLSATDAATHAPPHAHVHDYRHAHAYGNVRRVSCSGIPYQGEWSIGQMQEWAENASTADGV